MGEFGDKFRKAREKKELSYDDVSNVTKISSRMLQAIEEEHFDQLPGGVFNKGFIRAYAKHLGLNAEDAITDYLACLRQAQIDAHEVWDPQPTAKSPAKPHTAAPEKVRAERPHFVEPAKPAVESQVPSEVQELPELQLPRAEHVRPGRKDLALKPSRELPWGILAVAALIVVLGLVLWIRHTHTTNAATRSFSTNAAPSNTTAENLASAKPAPDEPATEKTALGKSAPVKHEPVKHKEEKRGPDAPAPPLVSVSSTPAPQPASSASVNAPPSLTHGSSNSQPLANYSAATPSATSPAADANGVDSDKNDVSVRTFPKSTAKLSVKSVPPLTLTIRATETSWISVLADGQPVSQETLIAPAHTSVRATREIVARIGNAAGVTFLWNGHEISADGAEAEVKTFVFDANGMRVLPQNP
ncbi:MAG TPA: RodZ domain-containing protein [Candidatus Sulfotelmatobacter sp.]